MEPQVPDYLFTFNAATRYLLLILTLGLIWLGLAKTSLTARQRLAAGATLSIAVLVWWGIAHTLAQQNVYWAPNNPTFPTIQFGILVPIIVGLILLTRFERVAQLVDAMPLSWLVGIQFYRMLGGMFLVLWLDGHLPWQFALPAGLGDVATGILALVVAGMIVKGAAGALSAAYAWCLFGIADLVVAVSMGALTSPGRTHLLSLDAPNLLISAYPLVMIPTFAVPISVILHGVCLWKLKRQHSHSAIAQTAS